MNIPTTALIMERQNVYGTPVLGGNLAILLAGGI
jgi:hypothetical protein